MSKRIEEESYGTVVTIKSNLGDYHLPLAIYTLFVDPKIDDVDKIGDLQEKRQFTDIFGKNQFELFPNDGKTCLSINRNLSVDAADGSNNHIVGELRFDKKGNLLLAECIILPRLINDNGVYTLKFLNGELILKHYNGNNLSTMFENVAGRAKRDFFEFQNLEGLLNQPRFSSFKPGKFEQVSFNIGKRKNKLTTEQILIVIESYYKHPSVLGWDILDNSVGKYIRNEIQKGEKSPKLSSKWSTISEEGNIKEFLYDVACVKDNDNVKLRFHFVDGVLTSIDGIAYPQNSNVRPIYTVSFDKGQLSVAYYSEKKVNSCISKFGELETFTPRFEKKVQALGDYSLIPDNNSTAKCDLSDLSPKEVIDTVIMIVSGGTTTCRGFVESPNDFRRKRER